MHPLCSGNPCTKQSVCRYRGFQLQRGERNTVPTVQGVLERALCQIRQESRETLRMQSSGRTDAGVHAKGQVSIWQSTQFDFGQFSDLVICHMSPVLASQCKHK